jgi:hypothetical protein
MIAILLTTLLAILGAQGLEQQRGTITGILRNADGRPVVGARVAALTRPESQLEPAAAADMASIAQTDEQGRYKLEDIPPGQYYVVAGRVDVPTYYPGTAQMSQGTIVKVAPGAALAGLDFSISDNSVRTAANEIYRAPVGRRSVSIRVVAENGGKLPVSSATGAMMLEFERAADGAVTSIPATATSAILEYVLASDITEYRVFMRNLPEGYEVKAISDGTQELTGANYVAQHPENARRRASIALDPLPPGAAIIYLSSRAGISTPLTVTVGMTAEFLLKSGGVRVTGMDRPGDRHPVYLSGVQGIVFSDGTFEFRNVPPGRHTIASIDSPGRARGTTVVVGDQNLDNIALTDVSTLPSDIQTPTSPGPTANRPAASTFPPVTLRARVVDEKSKQPLPGGQVYINDRSGLTFALDADGRFAIRNLLPGVYGVEILLFGYGTVNQEITVGVEDLDVELTSRKLY